MRRITPLPYAALVSEPLPLFPLNTPLVPGLVLPLHIFEPRYRGLVRDLLDMPDEDEREFGIIAVRDGRDIGRDGIDALFPIGVSAILRQAEELEDGRFEIVTTGSRRFRLLDLDDSAPLLRGEVEFLEDLPGPVDTVLTGQVSRRFHDYRAALSGQVQATVEDDEIPQDPTVLSYLVTAAMVIPPDERQHLLAAETTSERLAYASGLLSRETLLISELAAVPALDLPGAAPSLN
jgi:Lon protease-like protein